MKNNFIAKLLLFSLLLFLFYLGFATTHKQTWIYPIIGILFAFGFLYVERFRSRAISGHIYLLMSPFFATALLTAAYMVQYYSLGLSPAVWIEVAALRLLGQLETVALAVRYYNAEDGFLGMSGLGPLANLAGVERREPGTELPIYFLLRGEHTTLQGGFLVTGWSVAGYVGVVFVSSFVALLVPVVSASGYIIANKKIRACALAGVSLSLWTLTQLNLSTALVTGGCLTIIVTVILLRLLDPRKIGQRVALR